MVSMKLKTAKQYVDMVDQAIKLPFSHQLALINDIHRYGLDVESES